MKTKRFTIIGAGEVGFHLARLLSQAGHEIVVVDQDRERQKSVADTLDVATVLGNGAHLPVLERAGVGQAELVLAVSSSDEANLVASLLSKRLGAKRTVVRVKVAEDVTRRRRLYEESFQTDLILSTQLLTTVRILDHIRGHETMAIEYLAGGKVQLRKVRLPSHSPLVQQPLRRIKLPRQSLVVAYMGTEGLRIPSGEDVARVGDDALILGLTEVIDEVERQVTGAPPGSLGTVVVAGGGPTARTIVGALGKLGAEVKLVDDDRTRAEQLAARYPNLRVLRGDATDLTFLRSERIGSADAFVALSAQDERNLMASLLAVELGVSKIVTLAQRAERMRLWMRLGLPHVVAPRTLAYEKIREYIEAGYSARIVSLSQGAAVFERRLEEASPAAGVTLAELQPPKGLIVGSVVRGERVFVPRGGDRLEVGDTVLLFADRAEVDTVQLLFPGRDP